MLDRDITRVLNSFDSDDDLQHPVDGDLHGSGCQTVTRIPTLHLLSDLRINSRDALLRRAHSEDDRREQRGDDGAVALPLRSAC